MPLISDREDCFRIQYTADENTFTIIKVGIENEK